MHSILLSILARADGSPTTESNMRLTLLIGASIAGVGLLVRIVMLLAQRNGHRDKQLIDAAAIVWGLITFGDAILVIVQQWAWDKQHLQDMLAGYVDPHEPGPAYPWMLWMIFGGAYIAIFVWATRKNQ